MAKKFLESLGDPFEDNVLTDLIPTRQEREKTKAQRTADNASQKRGGSRRKKRFAGRIGEALEGEEPKVRRVNEKRFLETIEEALEDHAFDDLIPTRKKKPPRQTPNTPKTEEEEQVRFSMMITTRILDRAREVAEQKGVRIKDVINIALQRYIDFE